MKIIKSISIVLLFGILFQPLLFATPVDLNTATDVAEFQLKVKQKIKDFSLSDVIEFKNEKGITLVYIVNLDPKGFIAISTDTDITPIIAYSFNCNFPMDDDENNILYHMLKRDMELRLEAISEFSYPKMQENNNLWNYYITENLGYFRSREREQWPPEGTTSTGGWLETAWDQSSPYNNFCPLDPENGGRSVVGCVATAMAQIVNYHKYIGEASFDDSDEYISTLTIPNIHIDADSTTYDFPSFEQLNTYLETLEYKYQNELELDSIDIAALNFACGISVKMRYSSWGSGSYTSRIATALLDKFNYTPVLQYIGNDLYTEIYDKLAENNMNAKPGVLGVLNPDYLAGHAIVCDGYNTDNEYHLNFGWGENNPGGGITPIEAWYMLPEGIPSGFNVVQDAVVDIYSKSGIIEGNVVLNGGSGNITDVKVKAGLGITNPDENGDYSLRIPPGIYDVTAFLYGYFAEPIEDVIVEEDQIVENIDVTLDIYIPNTIYVDCNGNGDYLTIQEGINAAYDSDTVLVYSGTYIENINYNGKCIKVASLFLTTGDTTYISQTVIDGNQDGGVVLFYNSEDSNAVLSGVTITNGLAKEGGGVYCKNSSPILRNMMIIGNVAEGDIFDGYGGGIYCKNSSPRLEHVTINGNTAAYCGGGICSRYNSSPRLIDVRISGNTAYSSSLGAAGGGIYCASNMILENVTISGNASSSNISSKGGGIYCGGLYGASFKNVAIIDNSADKGGGICCISSNPRFEHVIISENTSETGGGILCWWDHGHESPTFTNVVITGNTASGSGGGISCWDSDAEIINALITGNSAVNGGGMSFRSCYTHLTNVIVTGNTANCGGAIHNWAGGMPTLVNCVLWNDTPNEIYTGGLFIDITYSDIQDGTGEIWFGTGCIDADPLFVDENNEDYHLLENSPCIDTGKPNTTWLNLPPWDLDGNHRIWDGDGNGTAIIDMGCYEYGAPPVGVNEEPEPQMVFKLYQNYPNPFSSSTTISFNLATKSHEKSQIKIYNIKGQLIKNFELRIPNSEFTGVVWDGKDKNNKPVSSGIYLYRLKIGNKVINTKKCLLLK